MPTIIDSLIIMLGFDDKKLQQGQARVEKNLSKIGKEADKTGEKLEQAGKQGAEGFSQASRKLSSFLKILGGAYTIKKFVGNITNTNAEIYRFSRNLGQSARDISAWSQAVEIAGGGSAQAFQGTLSMLSKAQTQIMTTGQSSLIPYMSRFGVAMQDGALKARSGTDILLDLADRMQGMDRTTGFNILQEMGIDEGTASAMMDGRKGLEALIAKQKQSSALTDERARKAEEARKAATKSAIATNAAQTKSVGIAEQLIKKFDDLNTSTQGWVSTLLTGAGALGGALVTIKAIKALLLGAPAAAPAASAVGGWLAGAAAWLGPAAAAFLSMFASDGLNKDEDKQLAAMRAREKAANGAPKRQTPKGTEAQKMAELERKYGLPSGLLDSVWKAESGRGKNMRSPAGAMGHFQFMPATAKEYGLKNPDDFDTSADAAARYYRDLIKRYGGDVKKAVAAYNWGMGNVDRKGLGAAPAETRGYMSKVLGGIPGAGMVANSATSRLSGNTTQTTIGEIKVYTQATDAAGIAKDIGKHIDFAIPVQANYGLR